MNPTESSANFSLFYRELKRWCQGKEKLPEILDVQGLFGEKELVRDAETGRKGAYAGITFIRLKFLKTPKLSKLQIF